MKLTNNSPLAGHPGLEPGTFALTAHCSNRLGECPIFNFKLSSLSKTCLYIYVICFVCNITAVRAYIDFTKHVGFVTFFTSVNIHK